MKAAEAEQREKRSRSVNSKWWLLVKVVGSVAFLWWVFRSVDDKALLGANLLTLLRSPGWMAAGLLSALVALLTAAWRWQILLRMQGIRESFGALLRLTFYGAFFGLLSSPAGDAAKMMVLMRKRPTQKVEVGLSVMADHMLGFVATAIIFLVAVWQVNASGNADGLGRQVFIGTSLTMLAGLLGVALAFFTCTPGMRKICERKFPKFAERDWVKRTFATMNTFRRSWQPMLGALAVSLVLSFTHFLTFYLGLATLGEVGRLQEVMTVMPIVDFAAALPLSISGLGVRERAFEYLMFQLSGIQAHLTVSASLIGFCFHTFWALAGGLIFLFKGSGKNSSA